MFFPNHGHNARRKSCVVSEHVEGMMPVLERALFAVGGILIFGGLLAAYAHERSLALAAQEREAKMMLMKLFVARPAEAAAAPETCKAEDGLLSPVSVFHWPVAGETPRCARMARN
jgi:hypothetical protein